jgi:hypothetical protein
MKVIDRKFPKIKYEGERLEGCELETPYITLKENEEPFDYIEIAEKRFSKSSDGNISRITSIKLKKLISLEYLQSVLPENIFNDISELITCDQSTKYKKWEVLAGVNGKSVSDPVSIEGSEAIGAPLEKFEGSNKWAGYAGLTESAKRWTNLAQRVDEATNGDLAETIRNDAATATNPLLTTK